MWRDVRSFQWKRTEENMVVTITVNHGGAGLLHTFSTKLQYTIFGDGWLKMAAHHFSE